MTEISEDSSIDLSHDDQLPGTEISATAVQLRHDAAAFLAAIVESSDDPIISKSLDGVITTWNKAAERVFGYTSVEAIGCPITILIPEERLDEEPAILARIHAGQRVDHFETVRRRKDGSLIDVSLTISPIRNASGEIIGASKIARDISERKRAAERQDLLLREMHHRVKNLFAITSSIISLAARSAETADGLARSMRDRLVALSKAHEMTLPSFTGDDAFQERSTTLFQLLSLILAPYDGGTACWDLEGDDVGVAANKVTSLSLLLHEFSTNAAKYGALSVEGGKLKVAVAADSEMVRITWAERLPGLLPQTAATVGFGSRLEKMISQTLRAEVSKEWKADGLTIVTDLPKASLQ
ncbi:PAS domain S-box protein [Neorhizobium sp. P12A]|nr:PAS domain S-box protein [Neorhizobium sp. P12A]